MTVMLPSVFCIDENPSDSCAALLPSEEGATSTDSIDRAILPTSCSQQRQSEQNPKFSRQSHKSSNNKMDSIRKSHKTIQSNKDKILKKSQKLRHEKSHNHVLINIINTRRTHYTRAFIQTSEHKQNAKHINNNDQYFINIIIILRTS